MKDKQFVIEYRRVENADKITALLFGREWKKWKSYKTERARSQALESCKRQFGFLEFRLRV